MSTIDPGIGEPVAKAATNINGTLEQNSEKERDGVLETEASSQDGEGAQDQSLPGHWWFASTAIPLIAATFGPMANGFSICALVYSWRAYIPPGKGESDGVKYVEIILQLIMMKHECDTDAIFV